MSTVTTTEWHPDWCVKDGDCNTDLPPEDRHHSGPVLKFQAGPPIEFTARIQRYAIGAPGNEYGIEAGVECRMTSDVYQDHHITFHSTPEDMRDFAAALIGEADQIQAWRDQQEES